MTVIMSLSAYSIIGGICGSFYEFFSSSGLIFLLFCIPDIFDLIADMGNFALLGSGYFLGVTVDMKH